MWERVNVGARHARDSSGFPIAAMGRSHSTTDTLWERAMRAILPGPHRGHGPLPQSASSYIAAMGRSHRAPAATGRQQAQRGVRPAPAPP